MEFRIRETDTGLFEIVRTRPVVVGSFPDQDTARKVMTFLVEDAMETMEAGPPALPAPVVEPSGQEPNVAPADWTDDELTDAFARLAKGESLKDIAGEVAKSWTSLRAKWAAHKRTKGGPRLVDWGRPTADMPGAGW